MTYLNFLVDSIFFRPIQHPSLRQGGLLSEPKQKKGLIACLENGCQSDQFFPTKKDRPQSVQRDGKLYAQGENILREQSHPVK